MLLSEAINKTFNGYVELKSKLIKDFELIGVASIEGANSGCVSYIDDKKYIKNLKDCNAGVVLVKEDMADVLPGHLSTLVVDNPHLAFALLSQLFAKKDFSPCVKSNVDDAAIVSPNATISNNVSIGANTNIMSGVVIGDNVEIGHGCKIYPNVVIYGGSKILNNVIIHAGSIIGSDGFGYAHTKDGRHIKIEHSGYVLIEDNVEIGANNTIDRAVFGVTHIKSGVKIDNLVQIGHNCIIGENTIIVSQVGLSGSTSTGRNVILGGQVGTGGHIHIGDFTQVAGRGAVNKNLPPNTKWGGHPLMELNEWMRFFASLKRMVKFK